MAIETVAVIGSGLMGRGIAYAAAVGGFRTVVHDLSAPALDRAFAQIRKDLDDGVARGKLTAADATAAFARLSAHTELSAVAEADFVIEAVPEDIAVKMRTFADLDATCPSDVVLATNTSALSITEIAAATGDPERVVGMHFFNPVPKMKLVEIVRALDTSEDAIAVTASVARRMGKETVLVRESPGFITSRINAMIGNEAFLMLQEGVATAEDIDKALKLGLNHPMGPFEMVDLVGLDTRLAVLEFLHKSLGEKYKPAPLLVQHVKAGRLGKKVGRGVYDYGGELMAYRNLILAVEGRLATLTMNRPDVRNALDTETVQELHRALDEVRQARCSVLIVTGAGDKAFISGADINAIRQRTRDDALASINSRLMSAIESHDAVSIAAVNGYALGGGCEVALACDLRIAAANAVFGLPEPTLGIIPGAGGTQRLPRIVGLGRAKEMILTGARWDAARALEAGLVSRVVPLPELPAAARALAEQVLALGPLAVRLAKAALNASSQMPLSAGLVFESTAQAITFESDDKMEGTTAFLEKRKPVFRGD